MDREMIDYVFAEIEGRIADVRSGRLVLDDATIDQRRGLRDITEPWDAAMRREFDGTRELRLTMQLHETEEPNG